VNQPFGVFRLEGVHPNHTCGPSSVPGRFLKTYSKPKLSELGQLLRNLCLWIYKLRSHWVSGVNCCKLISIIISSERRSNMVETLSYPSSSVFLLFARLAIFAKNVSLPSCITDRGISFYLYLFSRRCSKQTSKYQ